MKIIFVRHGQNKDDKLTHIGETQAKILVDDLIYENITKIYSSPLNRAIQTANIISKGLNIDEIKIDNRLSERETFKDTMTMSEIEDFKKNYLNPKFSRNNPEGLKEYLERIFEFLNEAIKNCQKEDTILIVGHSSMSYVLGAYFYGIPQDKDLIWTRVGNCSKICYEINKDNLK